MKAPMRDTKGSKLTNQPTVGEPQATDREVPQVISDGSSSESRPSKSNPNPRRGAIRYSNGLGWSEETESWWVHVRCGKSTYTRDTCKRNFRDAQSWFLNFRREKAVLAGADYIPHLTVEEGLRLWVANVSLEPMRSRPPTEAHVQNVRRVYELWVLPAIGRLEIERLQKSDLLGLVLGYREGEGPHGPHHTGGVRNFIIDLNIPLRWLLKTERVGRLPRLPLIPMQERRVPIIVPPEQFELLLQRYDKYVQHDLYAMIYIRVMALIGLRTSNARKLLKNQFSGELSQLATGITKNGHEYLLPVPQDLQVLLRLVPSMSGNEPLFPAPFAKKGRSAAWYLGAFRRAAEDIGMSVRVAWHRLRATYASVLVDLGVDVFTLQILMGWETIAVAVRYVKTSSRRLVSAQIGAADLLTSRGGGGGKNER